MNGDRGGRVLVAGIAVYAILVGVRVVASAYDRLWRTIIPTWGTSYSSSLEPYEISLRSQREDDWDHRVAWSLTVPRTFVIYELGTNGSENYFSYPRSPIYFVTLRGLVDLKKGTFGPFSPTADRGRDRERLKHSAMISLTNHNGLLRRGTGATCFKDPGYGGCTAPTEFCRIQLYFKGWDVEISAPIGDYDNYQAYCGIVSAFLEEHTSHIDPITYKENRK